MSICLGLRPSCWHPWWRGLSCAACDLGVDVWFPAGNFTVDRRAVIATNSFTFCRVPSWELGAQNALSTVSGGVLPLQFPFLVCCRLAHSRVVILLGSVADIDRRCPHFIDRQRRYIERRSRSVALSGLSCALLWIVMGK